MVSRSYPPLYLPFVWGSFLAAVFGGFLLAAYLSVNLGRGWWSGALLFEIIQLHGHLQLMGWMGMLLLGVTLCVLPRLLSASSQIKKLDVLIFLLLLAGILLRTIAPFFKIVGSDHQVWGGVLLLLSSLLEAGGITCYLIFCTRLALSARAGNNDFKRLWPYFAAMFSGWSLFALGQLLLAFLKIGQHSVLLDQEWNGFLSDLFVRLVLVPAIFGFGAKMLPVFLGLTPPRWPVRNVGIALLVSSTVYLSGKGLLISLPLQPLGETLRAIGLLGISCAVIAYIWFLDALLFRVLPERIALKVHRSDVKQQRGRFGDKGEYGRFELFIVVGFVWLLIVALIEGANAVRQLTGGPEFVSSATLRHGLLLGALAHLVLGVSHRLLPSLIGRQLLSPKLTAVSFCFLFLSSLLRVLPLAISDLGLSVPMTYFSWSGVVGLIAISFAFINILGKQKAS